MKIEEAWQVIESLDIELVEQYSESEYNDWHNAINTLRKFLQPILVEPKDEVVTKAQPKKRQRKKSHRTQFELKGFFRNSSEEMEKAYEWCLKNLPLKEEHSIIWQVNEVFIITSSQAVIDKVNKHFGSEFSFGIHGERIWYLS